MGRKSILLAAMAAVAVPGAAVAQHHNRGDVRHDRREVRQDRHKLGAISVIYVRTAALFVVIARMLRHTETGPTDL